MNTLFYFSLALNVIFLLWLYFLLKKKTLTEESTIIEEETQEQAVPTPKLPKIMNAKLHKLAKECDAKLPIEYQGKVKILVEKDHPDKAAILQICNINISIRRLAYSKSILNAETALDAVSMACYGYEGTGRYIPVPSELEYILGYKNIINVYLQALGLEQISDENDYWTVDVETGWNTGWKRFGWNVEEAYDKLKDKFKVRTEETYINTTYHENGKLILLLKGWEQSFAEA